VLPSWTEHDAVPAETDSNSIILPVALLRVDAIPEPDLPLTTSALHDDPPSKVTRILRPRPPLFIVAISVFPWNDVAPAPSLSDPDIPTRSFVPLARRDALVDDNLLNS
jgi:hypothetical protein